MSFIEVNNLRKLGRLEEAYAMAKSDFEHESSDWTLKAMFWVLRDKFNADFAEDDKDASRDIVMQMEKILSDMQDDDIAKRAMRTVREKMCPNGKLIDEASALSKEHREKEAYDMVMTIHANVPIEEMMHEKFGWIIFRYLSICYKEIGSLKARTALFEYMKLKNKRPSLLHSQMLNLASKISEEYHDFKFLPFLNMWDVCNFTDEDLLESVIKDHTIQPLYLRLFKRCIALGYPLDKCLEVFCQNKSIDEAHLVDAYSQQYYFDIYNTSKAKDSGKAFSIVSAYANGIEGRKVINEYHSKIVRSFIYLNKEEISPNAKVILEKLGFTNFAAEDWRRQTTEGGEEMPSLVERFSKVYHDSLSVAASHVPDAAFEELLLQVVSKYRDNDQSTRHLAQAYVQWGRKEDAEKEYRKLLLSLNKFYVWHELSQIVDNEELKLSALCKAILSQPKDEFLGEIHLELAALLIRAKAYPEALCELNTYAATYSRNGWRPKDKYRILSQQIPAATIPNQDNKELYDSHLTVAEEFVYADIPWTLMTVMNVFDRENENGKKSKLARLVSSEGKSVVVNAKMLGINLNKALQQCFDVKITAGEKPHVVLIKKSDRTISDLFEEKVGYVDYYNENKQILHIYDKNSTHYILENAQHLKKFKFFKFCVIPEYKKQKPSPNYKEERIQCAMFSSKSIYEDALQEFPEHIGVVDNVNQAKQLFHCIFGASIDAIVRFDKTNIRPESGDIVRARYIVKVNNGIRRVEVIDIIIDNEATTSLLKNVQGIVNIHFYESGKKIALLEQYYIPEYFLANIENGDVANIKVVYDRMKWKIVRCEKVSL